MIAFACSYYCYISINQIPEPYKARGAYVFYVSLCAEKKNWLGVENDSEEGSHYTSNVIYSEF